MKNQTNPLVSLIIPCYNGQEYISKSIHSALNQTYKNTEIILVDNNSKDNTLRILHDFKEVYPSKIQVLSETKQGATAARNKGLFHAKGEWIQFLDSDDELRAEKILNQIRIATDEDASLIIGNYYSSAGDRITKIACITDLWEGLILSKLGITSANLFKRTDIMEVGSWNEDMHSSQEYDLMFRLLQRGVKVGIDSSYNTKINIRPESVSKSHDKEIESRILKSRLNLRAKIIKYLEDSGQLTIDTLTTYQKLVYYLLAMHRLNHPAVYHLYIKGTDFSYVPLSFKAKMQIKAFVSKLKKTYSNMR